MCAHGFNAEQASEAARIADAVALRAQHTSALFDGADRALLERQRSLKAIAESTVAATRAAASHKRKSEVTPSTRRAPTTVIRIAKHVLLRAIADNGIDGFLIHEQ